MLVEMNWVWKYSMMYLEQCLQKSIRKNYFSEGWPPSMSSIITYIGGMFYTAVLVYLASDMFYNREIPLTLSIHFPSLIDHRNSFSST